MSLIYLSACNGYSINFGSKGTSGNGRSGSTGVQLKEAFVVEDDFNERT